MCACVWLFDAMSSGAGIEEGLALLTLQCDRGILLMCTEVFGLVQVHILLTDSKGSIKQLCYGMDRSIPLQECFFDKVECEAER